MKLNNLPDEMINEVFQYLDTLTIKKSLFTLNKFFNDKINNLSLLDVINKYPSLKQAKLTGFAKEVYFTHFFKNTASIKSMISNNVHEINTKNKINHQNEKDLMAIFIKKIKSIDVKEILSKLLFIDGEYHLYAFQKATNTTFTDIKDMHSLTELKKIKHHFLNEHTNNFFKFRHKSKTAMPKYNNQLESLFSKKILLSILAFAITFYFSYKIDTRFDIHFIYFLSIMLITITSLSQLVKNNYPITDKQQSK
ncbi:MAG: hypothetical protein LEGION0398_MBIBDBAK_00800 [Legionellaceae bacterium]